MFRGLVDEPPDELARVTRAALAAYGATFDVPAILAREYELAAARCRRNGWHRQLARLPAERDWLAANESLLGDQP